MSGEEIFPLVHSVHRRERRLGKTSPHNDIGKKTLA
jgi:hypothetical protein